MINISFLNQWKTLCPQDWQAIVLDICNLFLTANQQDCLDLQAALQRNDYATLARLAHKIRSSCANVGAMEIAQSLQELELAALEENKERVQILGLAFLTQLPELTQMVEKMHQSLLEGASL